LSIKKITITRSTVYTAIELESHGENYLSHRNELLNPPSQAKRAFFKLPGLATQTVPNGGYGWAVIFGYGVITLGLISII
jgi:hypothetical protein